ncbi:HEAT repeat domain-containing protein [Tychonema sp. BBK16]|uniref:NACHT C-terminal alpha/beta 1 domain-containing protein n=1 Tax=Tychonema sp. BBK16 TaxID=2699888 RepID=UPI001F3DD467|nr:HEAT repeat domain-containing protein [Tychonema sp. BBK16]MCF6373650.1 HEAT repeat domain-containing protein [Tychonema sp. BBK16]
MPSKDKVTYGPIVKERAKRLLEALLDYVNCELEDFGGISLSHKWHDETTEQPKLMIKTELRTLEFLTAKDKHEGKLTTTEIRQALNQHLKDFLEILEDHRLETQGDDEWHFTLTLWSKDKQKNLEQFEIKWESLRPEKSKQQEETLRKTVAGQTPKPKEEPINWQEICRQNLALQKELTTNLFTNANGMTPQLDGVYVPLAIVERQKPKPQPRNQQEEKEKETEKLIPIAEERFFEDVLRQGKSDISQGRKIAIIGEPGAGKTTRLQKIADWILEQDLGLPIWIDLAELGDRDICQYLEKVWLYGCPGGVTRGDLEAQMSRVWLLLDGVDEMANTQGMQQLSKDLLRTWVQAARVVVTCRVNVWEADKNAFSGFDVFRNLEFNAEQVTEYIRRWFAGMGDAATGESLEAALAKSENSRLKELIQNPLRLWMLCQIWQTGGGLPKTQAGLYGQFVDWVYRWKADEEILDQREAIDTALARLALAAMEQKEEVSRLRLRESWVLKVLESRPIFEAVKKLGWLNRVERFPEAICVFYHATFQEYFAALAVKNWDYFLPRNHVDFPVVGKEYRIFEAQWKQVILLWLGLEGVGKEEKKGFIEKLVNFDDGCGEWDWEKIGKGFYEYRASFLASSGINEFKPHPLANKIVNQLVKLRFGYFSEEKQAWQNHIDVISRYVIINKILTQTDKASTIQEICSILENPQYPESFYRSAICVLGEIGQSNSQSIAALNRILKNTQNNEIRHQALIILNKIQSERLSTIDVSIKTTTIPVHHKKTSNSQDFDKNQPLIELLLDESIDNATRENALYQLNKTNPKNSQIINILVEVIDEKANNISLRWLALKFLGEIDLEDIAVTRISMKIIENFKKEDERLLFKAVRSLRKSVPNNDGNTVDLLLFLLNETKNEDRQYTILEVLGKIGHDNPKAIATLTGILATTKDKNIRFKCADSLGKIDPGNCQAVDVLIKILENTKHQYTSSISILPDLHKQFENFLESSTALDSLGKIGKGSKNAIHALVKVLEIAKAEYARKRATKSLLKIITTDEHRQEVVSLLQPHLNTETYENNFDLFEDCYAVLWNIAQNLPYLDFYRVWHDLTENQTCLINLAQLPQLLQAQLTEINLAQTFQLLCIDTSKFIDSDNPALDIYGQFLDKNFPQHPNREPETLPQLKSYWNQLRRDSDKHLILIFYEGPTSPATQGLNPSFLNALTRFDGTICLIADTPHPPLQTFSPHDSDLVQSVVNWLEKVHLES